MSGVFIHVQHFIGVGHQRRMAAIARALSSLGIPVCYVSGGMPVTDLDIGSSLFIQLPPVRAVDARYENFVDETGEPVSEIWRQRRLEKLLYTFDAFSPSVLIVETYPFGRSFLDFELRPLLARSKSGEDPTVNFCSIRDILEPKIHPQRNIATVDKINRWFDGVLVHSDPNLVGLEESFPLCEKIRDKIQYTGYIVDLDGVPVCVKRIDEILVSIGGGNAGEKLVRTAIAAAKLPRADQWHWRCLVSPHLVRRGELLEHNQSCKHLTVEPNRKDFTKLLSRCAVSIQQAGYNTVVESLVLGTPCVLIPFSDWGEKEQTIRAEAVAKISSILSFHVEEVTPVVLLESVEQLCGRESSGEIAMQVDGAKYTAEVISAVIAKKLYE